MALRKPGKFCGSQNISAGRYTITDEFPVRPSWCEAALCLEQMRRGKAKGNKPALILREYLQTWLYYLGWFIQHYCAIVLPLLILIFCLFGVGLRKIQIETNIEKLWVPRGGRLESEREFAKTVAHERAIANNWTIIVDKTGISDDSATGYQVLIQTTKRSGDNILDREQLLLHTKLLQTLSTFSVEQYGRNWTLKDICFKAKMPKAKGSLADIMGDTMDNIVPCILITPMDCFWEGSKPLGPFPPDDEFMGFNIAWKKLNPENMLRMVSALGLFEAEDIDAVKDMFTRAGIGSAYQTRYCIDPLDPECPTISKNYINFCPVLKKFLRWNNKHGEYSLANVTNTKSSTAQKPSKFNESDYYADFYEGSSHSDGGGGDAGGDDILGGLFGGGDGDGKDEKADNAPECKNTALVNTVKDILRWNQTLADMFIPGAWSNYGKIMTGGCSGFATRFMQWPEQLIIGGVKRSENGTILSAEGLQTILMISNHNDLYLRYQNSSKLNYSSWSPHAAVKLLKTWQRKYANILFNWPNNTQGPRRIIHPLAAASLEDMVDEFSNFNPAFILIGYGLMIIYAGLSALSFSKKGVRSCTTLALSGCFTVLLANVAGLGCTLIVGIDFNATTTQILPFLLLSLGVDEMFLLLNKYREIIVKVNKDEIAILLRETGLSVLITYVNNILAFLAGGLLPLPALKIFCIQVAIVLVFNLVAIITIFPAFMAFDLIRQRAGYVDFLCCIKGEKVTVKTAQSHQSPVTYYNGDTMKVDKTYEPAVQSSEVVKKPMQKLTLTKFVNNIYSPVIQKLPMKIVVVIVFIAVMCGSIVGLFRIPIGLELSEIVPAGTPPHAFFVAREEYFSFYPMYPIVRGPNFDFAPPQNQKLIRDFLDEMKNITYVVNTRMKTDWLHMMMNWLQTVQDKFDIDYELGAFNGSRLTPPSRLGRIGYTLICNYGDKVDCKNRIGKVKMIDKNNNNYINEEGFYNYLTAWFNIDQMTYTVSQANFFPSPPEWVPNDDEYIDVKIPPTPKFKFSQFAIFIDRLYDTDATVDMINQVRAVTEKYNGLGLPVFPLGIPFTFWELYLHLTKSVLSAFGIIVAAVFVAISIMLMNPWIATLIVVVLLLMIIVELGFMGLIHIKLNPISAVTLITAVGIRVKFTVHVALSFLTTVGTRNERVSRTLEHMFVPVLHGGVSTLVGLIMLAFTKFEFILMYYFLIMFALVILGILSGLILMPVILSWIGPPSEVQPLDGSSYLAPPDSSELQNNGVGLDNKTYPTNGRLPNSDKTAWKSA